MYEHRACLPWIQNESNQHIYRSAEQNIPPHGDPRVYAVRLSSYLWAQLTKEHEWDDSTGANNLRFEPDTPQAPERLCGSGERAQAPPTGSLHVAVTMATHRISTLGGRVDWREACCCDPWLGAEEGRWVQRSERQLDLLIQRHSFTAISLGCLAGTSLAHLASSVLCNKVTGEKGRGGWVGGNTVSFHNAPNN